MKIDSPALVMSDAEAAAVAKTEDRVSLTDLHCAIKNVEIIRPESAPLSTLAVVTLLNGFTVIGHSACADPKNFNASLGEKFATEDAVRQIWPLEGYLLKQRLSEREE